MWSGIESRFMYLEQVPEDSDSDLLLLPLLREALLVGLPQALHCLGRREFGGGMGKMG